MLSAREAASYSIREAASLAGIALAFARRGVAVYVSYKAKLSLGAVSAAVSLVTFLFVGRVVASAGSGFVERYGMSYSSFVLTGVVVHTTAVSWLFSFRSTVRREQLQGTLELLAATPVPLPLLVVLSGSVGPAVSLLGGLLFLRCASVLPGIDVRITPVLAAVMVLYAAVMAGAGLASAGFVLVSKEGDPVSWLVGAASGLLGGVYFPVEVLPAWLRPVSTALPTTRALNLARSALTLPASASGAEAATLRGLSTLAIPALVSLAAGAAALSWGARKARANGSIAHY